MPDFKDIILEKAKEKGLEDKVVPELTFLEQIEDKDGKPFLKTLETYYNEFKGKVGHANAVNLWSVYVLGLTDKKPAANKKFEKRRVYARSGYPDIDSDFDYEFQHYILNYITDKYGHDRVSRIGTYNALKLKSYITRVFKALDPDKLYKTWKDNDGKLHHNKDEWKKMVNLKVREIINSLYGDRENVVKLKLKDENGEEHVINNIKEAAQYSDSFRFYTDKYPELLVHSDALEGLLSQYGIHPAGIVISSIPLADIAPVRHTKDENSDNIVYATQYTNEDLELLGLIKFDVLALSTLSVVRQCCDLVKENYGIDVPIKNLPLDDQKTFALYRSGKLTGVFQCESYPMQETMKQIGVNCFDDIMAGISLFRPGPMDSIPEYCSRKQGTSPITFFDKSIEPFVKKHLAKTYGILCYQEQVMHICNSLAGLTIAEAYQVIKAISKKKGLDKHKAKFVKGCCKNKVPEQVANDYWEKFIMPFASYGFNASHSCCYAYASYQTAYLKAHFPEEFMTAYMNVEVMRSKYIKVEKLEKECEKMGIKILDRKLNSATLNYRIVRKKDTANGVENSEIMPPIRCKGLSEAAAQNIVENGPYSSIRDFAEKTSVELVDSKAVESLVEAGFFTKDRKNDPVKEFSVVRDDLKKSRRRGVAAINIFDSL